MTLEQLGIPCELRVVSAHRTPDHLFRYAETARGPRDPGDHRRRRRRRPPAGHARRQDDAARSSACRSRPSTSAASTRCCRSSRCRAGSRSRPSPSATPRTRRCSPRRSSRCPTRSSRRGVEARRDAQTEAVLGDPSQRGAAPGLTGRTAGDAAARRPARVDSPRWTTNAGSRGCRFSIGSPCGPPRRASPACRRASRACRRGASPRPPRRPLQKHYVLLCAPALVAGFIAITALEIGAGLGSPLVKLCVLIAAPLLLVTTLDATLRIWRAAWAWMPVDRNKGLFRLAWVVVSLVFLALIVVAHGPGHRGLGWSAD